MYSLAGNLITFYLSEPRFAGIFIVAAKRTPFGTYGGKFVQKSAAELQEAATKAALAAGGIKPELIDSVVFGNVLAVSCDSLVQLCFYVLCFCNSGNFKVLLLNITIYFKNYRSHLLMLFSCHGMFPCAVEYPSTGLPLR